MKTPRRRARPNGAEPVLFTSGGTLDDSLAVIENEAEFNALMTWTGTTVDRVGFFVQSLNWCNGPTNAIGCAPIGGTRFVVALDAIDSVRSQVIAHERGHNAGLVHRETDTCALMSATASSAKGCLTQDEATAFYFTSNIVTSASCGCIDFNILDFESPWSLPPQGEPCEDGEVCTLDTECDAGLCEGGRAAGCGDGLPDTEGDCVPDPWRQTGLAADLA